MSFTMQQVQISDFVISDQKILSPTCCLRPKCLHSKQNSVCTVYQTLSHFTKFSTTSISIHSQSISNRTDIILFWALTNPYHSWWSNWKSECGSAQPELVSPLQLALAPEIHRFRRWMHPICLKWIYDLLNKLFGYFSKQLSPRVQNSKHSTSRQK